MVSSEEVLSLLVLQPRGSKRSIRLAGAKRHLKWLVCFIIVVLCAAADGQAKAVVVSVFI